MRQLVVRNLAFLVAILLLVFFTLHSAQAQDSATTGTLTGIVRDAAGAAMPVPGKPGESGMLFCRQFDDKGNTLAKDYLAKTQDEKNIRVTVEGNRHGDQIDVTDIKKAG